MGYYVESISSNFTFKPGTDLVAVLQHVKQEMFTDEALEKKATGGSWPKEGKDIGAVTWYSWTNTAACRSATSIYDILGEFFEDVDISDCGMEFTVYVNTKLGQEHILLKTLAPFLVDGSHLYYRGEDGSHFGWRVENGISCEVNATLTWN